jgi:hypothetical protein
VRTRASKNKDGFKYPPLASYKLRHNVAHDMLRVTKWAADATDKQFKLVFAAYARPLIALIFACAAIEGYVNYVGQSLLADWRDFSKGARPNQKGRPGIKDRIKEIYLKLDQSVSFDSGIYNQVCDLFEKRGYLMHPTLDEREYVGKAPPADILEMIGDDYAPAKVFKLANNFRSRILNDSKVEDHYWSVSYAEKLKNEKRLA